MTRKRGEGQIGLTKGLGVFEPWTGENTRIDPPRRHMSAVDDARLTELVGRGLTLTQIAPLMGGKTYAVLTEAMERLGLVHEVPVVDRQTPKLRPSLYAAWEGVATRGLFVTPHGAGSPARRPAGRMGRQP